MKSYFRAASLFLILVILLLSCGCKKDYREAYIYFELSEQPVTVDPQTASTDSDLLIVRNIFEGLLRKNESGSIVCGIADSYEQSGLTYTFKLRDNAVWSDGEAVTAADFVFGFRRAVSPATKSPFVSNLFCISNAENISKGNMPLENLGVTAVDEHTLIITLCRDDESFKDTLTSAVAMPCNEHFFNESIGKYGLTAENTLSNGSYELTKWNRETFGIRLYTNEKYTGSFKANNAAVFLSKNEKEEPLSLLKDNNVDMAFIDPGITDSAKLAGMKTIGFENTCWVLTVSSSFSNEMRTAFAKLISPDVYGKSLKSGYRTADSIFPSELGAGDAVKSYGVTPYDLDGGKTLFSKAVSKLDDKKFPSSVKLYYYDDGNIKSTVTSIVGHWQNNLGAYINIEPSSSPDLLLPELESQTCDMAVFPVSANDNSIKSYLKNYGIDYTGEDLPSIQASLLSSKNIIPIAFESTTIACTPALGSVYTECGNGYIDFSFIIKIE